MLLFSLCAAAQVPQLYGVWAGIGGRQTIFAIDPTTGAMTPRVTTDATTLAGGISTFDPVGKRFFFMSDPDLYAVNVATGTFTHVALSTFPLLQFDVVTNTLWGVAFQGPQVEVFAVNPATGVLTPRIATGTTTLSGGISAFDPIGRRLFFVSSAELYVVNVDSGAVAHVSLGGRYPLLHFDSSSNTLYGVWDLGGHTGIYTVDPSSGVMTALFATTATSLAGGIIAFDPFARNLYFMADGDLYTANVSAHTSSHVSLGGAFPLLQVDAPALAIDVFDHVIAACLLAMLATVGAFRMVR